MSLQGGAIILLEKVFTHLFRTPPIDSVIAPFKTCLIFLSFHSFFFFHALDEGLEITDL